MDIWLMSIYILDVLVSPSYLQLYPHLSWTYLKLLGITAVPDGNRLLLYNHSFHR